MKNLSLYEFSKLEAVNSSKEFLYSSENQLWELSNTRKTNITFDEMFFYFNPNVVYLSCPSGKLWFNNVKSVELLEAACPLGLCFRLVCTDSAQKHGVSKYTIIMR